MKLKHLPASPHNTTSILKDYLYLVLYKKGFGDFDDSCFFYLMFYRTGFGISTTTATSTWCST